MKRFLNVFLFSFFAFFAYGFLKYAFAADGDITEMGYLALIIDAWKQLGQLGGLAKVSSIIMLVTASFKVPGIRSLLWDKLNFKFKAAIPLVLGLIAGILDLHPITFTSVMAYATGTGLGAILIYELLDFIKVTYATNATVNAIIGFVQGILGKK